MAGKFFDLDIQRELPGNLSNRDRYVDTSDISDIQVGIEADTPPSEDNLSGVQIEQPTINIQTDISETIDTSLFYFRGPDSQRSFECPVEDVSLYRKSTNYFYRDVYENYDSKLRTADADEGLGLYSFYARSAIFHGDDAEAFHQGPGNLLYPSFSAIDIMQEAATVLGLDDTKDYVFYKLYSTGEQFYDWQEEVSLSDINRELSFLREHSNKLFKRISDFMPLGVYQEFRSSVPSVTVFEDRVVSTGKGLESSVANRNALEYQITTNQYESLEGNQKTNFIIDKEVEIWRHNDKEQVAALIKFKKPTITTQSDFIPNYINAINSYRFDRAEYSLSPETHDLSISLSVSSSRRDVLQVNTTHPRSIRGEEMDISLVSYDMSEAERQATSIYGDFAPLVSEPEWLKDLRDTKTRSLEDIFGGELACSDLFMVEVQKFHDERLVQTFYIINDVEKLRDYQVSYGKNYTYKVYEHHFIYGNELVFSNNRQHQIVEQESLKIDSYIAMEYENASKIKSIRRFVGQGNIGIFANPYSEPSVEFVPHKGKKNKISLYLENSNSTTRLEESELGLTYPKILDGDYIREQYLASEEQQVSISYDYVSEHSSTPSNLRELISSTSELYFAYDEESGIEPKYFEVFRAVNKPLNYSDFANNLHARISCKDSGGKIKSSFMFDDSVAENTKYWYMVRVVDTADQPSLPSKIYEYEMVKENDVLIPTITSIDLNPLPSKEVVTAKKVVRISPRPEHVILGTDGEIQSSDFEWGSRYKIKMRSAKTGKKIDVNFKSTKPNKESIE